jgi:hypothetical protein
MIDWTETRLRLPPYGLTVETKTDDEGGVRNVQRLKCQAGLWWTPDDKTYVCSPTHWRDV